MRDARAIRVFFSPVRIVGSLCPAFFLVFYFQIAPLRADAMHDGIVLASAIGVSEGRHVLSEVFFQYGPVPPIIGSFIISIFNAQLLGLRYFAAITIVLTGICTYFFAKRFTTNKVAASIAIYWLACSAIWSTDFPGSLVLWPSMFSTLFTVVGTWMLVYEPKTRKGDIQIFMAGILFGLAGFCRIQAFAIFPAIAILTAVFFRKDIKRIVPCLVGFLLTISTAIFLLLVFNSLDDYLHQAVITPLIHYTGVGASQNHNIFQLPLYVLKALTFVTILAITLMLLRRINSKALVLGFVTILLVVSISIGQWIKTLSLSPRTRVILGESLSDVLLMPYYFCAVALVVISFLVFVLKTIDIGFSKSTILIVGLVTLLQLYPQPDVMHLWWISPILLVSLPILVNVSFVLLKSLEPESLKNHLSAALVIVLLASSLLGIVKGVDLMSKPRYMNTLPVMKGTFNTKALTDDLRIFDVIPEYSIDGKSSFDCQDGIYSVANGRYLASDKWFVNWGNSPKEKQLLGETHFICNKTKGYAEKFAQSKKMDLIYFSENESGSSIAVLKKGND